MLIENLGNAVGFEQQFSTPGHAGKADGFVEKKKAKFLSKSNLGEQHCEGENLEVPYLMNLVRLVAFENFE